MAETQSHWRRIARRTIADVLAALPPGATEADKRKALHDAYPFGERSMWPYKCWCAEVRRALGLPNAVERARATVEVRPDGVVCDWCNNKGCLCCATARDFYQAHAAWLAAIREQGRPAALAFADWLEEQGEAEALVVEWRTKEL